MPDIFCWHWADFKYQLLICSGDSVLQSEGENLPSCAALQSSKFHSIVKRFLFDSSYHQRRDSIAVGTPSAMLGQQQRSFGVQFPRVLKIDQTRITHHDSSKNYQTDKHGSHLCEV